MAAVLGIESGEGTAIGLMVTLYFIVSISYVLVQTTAFALFVQEFGSQSLPFAYLSIAILASVVAYVYLKVSDRLAFDAAQYVNLAFLVAVCVAFWAGLRSRGAHWVILLLPFWFQALVNQANLIVWHLAGHMFDVRQAKRLFGLIGAGNWLANIIGGAVVAAVLALTGTADAYLLAGAALILSAPVLTMILRRLHAASAQHEGERRAAVRTESKTGVSPFRQPYIRLIFAYTLLWWLGFCFIDNIFYDRAGIEFPSGTDLASFIARQLSVMGIIAIITTLFLTSRIVRRYGLRAGLLAMPLIVSAAVLLLAVGGPLGWSAAALFWIATIAKTLNVALGFSISQVTGSLLFQPVFGHQRSTAQTISEGIVQPVAMGLAGLILLVFSTILHFNAVGLSYLFLIIAGVWFWVMIRLAHQYPLVMSEALLKRSLGETTTLVFDPSALEQLRASLRSPRAGLAIYALNQLEQLTPEDWTETLKEELPRLLIHAAPEVRREALRRVLALRLETALPEVRGRLPLEGDPQVRATMIQVLAAMGDAASAPQVKEALDSPDGGMRRGAILGLLASGRAGEVRRGEEALRRLVISPAVADRLLGAQILGEAPSVHWDDELTALMDDTDLAVRRAAIRSAGRLDQAEVIPALLRACACAETALLAEQVLGSKGPGALGAIKEALEADGDTPVSRQQLQSLVRALGRIPEPRSIELLVPRISVPDPQIRLEVLRALSAIGYRAKSAGLILAQIREEVALASSLSAALDEVSGLAEEPKLGALEGALKISFMDARRRALLLLSFLYHAEAILRAEAALDGTAHASSPVALETVDALLPAGIKPLVLPLIEDFSHGDRLTRWHAGGLVTQRGEIRAMLSSLIGDAAGARYETWTRLCAVYAAAVLGEKSCVPALEELRLSPEPALAAMSRWSLARLASIPPEKGDGNMLSIVEKVLILKSSPLFSETPDNVLADIADLVEEIAAEEKQVIFQRGEPGDSLYIIVSGAVQVWEGERLLNTLGEGDLFGELALLDPEPRLATVKTTESTRLLRLDESHFHEVLAVRPEVSAAIIRVITRYLRSQLQYAREVNDKLRSLESFSPLSNPAHN